MMVVTAAVALPPSASSSPSPSHEPASPSPNLLSGSLNGTLTMDGESPSSAPPTPVNGNGTNGMNAAAATVTSASSSNGGGVYPRASLVCRPNSHPFQDRTLTLDQSVKVGRSVARARPAPANAIFDCKVLSRNHALLWYEQGKFYLQDTKSSNGTFVNNQRLSKGSEESLPREVCSGDILQFGVDVMENSRKVTHGCIIATLKLYLPDGKEAKASPTIMSSSGSNGHLPTQDLYQLNQYIQDALAREQLLETKLAVLQRLVGQTEAASGEAWKSLIDEDRLLTRVEILESQLSAYSKSMTEDKLRDEAQRLMEEKEEYQEIAKVTLKKIMDEKLEAVKKLKETEKQLSTTEDEYAVLKELYDRDLDENKKLAEQTHLLSTQIDELKRKLPSPSSPSPNTGTTATGATEEDAAAADSSSEMILTESAAPVTKDQMQTSQDHPNSGVSGGNEDEDDEEEENDSSPNASVNTSQEVVLTEEASAVANASLLRATAAAEQVQEEEEADEGSRKAQNNPPPAATTSDVNAIVKETALLLEKEAELKNILEKCHRLEELNASLRSEIVELRPLASSEITVTSSSSKNSPLAESVSTPSPAMTAAADSQQSEKVIESLRLELRGVEEERESLRQEVKRLSAATSSSQSSRPPPPPPPTPNASSVCSSPNSSSLTMTADSSSSSSNPAIEERINQLLKVKEKFVEISADKSQLEQSFQELEKEVETLTLQSQTATACCLIPLAILVLAVIIAYLPVLAPALGTSDQI